MGLELSALSENIISVPFNRGSQSVELQVNIDALTPEFYRKFAAQMDAKNKALPTIVKKPATKGRRKKTDQDEADVAGFDVEATLLELQREMYAEYLTCQANPKISPLLAGWDVIENGIPLPVTKEVLVSLPPRLVSAIWKACSDACKTVKKKEDAETEETSENTLSGSRAPLALAPAS